jgi:hypothetical protein
MTGVASVAAAVRAVRTCAIGAKVNRCVSRRGPVPPEAVVSQMRITGVRRRGGAGPTRDGVDPERRPARERGWAGPAQRRRVARSQRSRCLAACEWHGRASRWNPRIGIWLASMVAASVCRLDAASLSKVGDRGASARRQRLAGPLVDHSGELAERIACGRARIFKTSRKTGQVVPFFVPSRPLPYPPVPVGGPGNYLSVFRMHCATIASCWWRLLSLNQ